MTLRPIREQTYPQKIEQQSDAVPFSIAQFECIYLGSLSQVLLFARNFVDEGVDMLEHRPAAVSDGVQQHTDD